MPQAPTLTAAARPAPTALCPTKELRSRPLLRQRSNQSLRRVRRATSVWRRATADHPATGFCVFAPVDAVDASLPSDLSADLLGLEVESWSLAVSPDFCKQHDRRTVKRQDVIYGGEALPHTHIHTQYYICPLYSTHCACNDTFRPLSPVRFGRMEELLRCETLQFC